MEPEPAKFKSKGAGVGATKGKCPAPESELRIFEILAPKQEPEPLKFSRLNQPFFKHWQRSHQNIHTTTFFK